MKLEIKYEKKYSNEPDSTDNTNNYIIKRKLKDLSSTECDRKIIL